MVRHQEKTDLHDFSQAGFPVIQEVEAVEGHVHHVNGVAVSGPHAAPSVRSKNW